MLSCSQSFYENVFSGRRDLVKETFSGGVKRWARQPAIWPNPVGPSGEARRQSSNGAQRERIQVDERAKWRRVKMEAVMGSQTAWPLPCTPEQPAWKATTQLWWEKKKNFRGGFGHWELHPQMWLNSRLTSCVAGSWPLDFKSLLNLHALYGSSKNPYVINLCRSGWVGPGKHRNEQGFSKLESDYRASPPFPKFSILS